jgi:hypothetical protein
LAKLTARLILAAWLSSAAVLNAQENVPVSQPNLWWLNIGAGYSSGLDGQFGMPGLLFGFSHKSKIGLLSFRATYYEDFQICLFGGCANPNHVWDLGGLYGISTKSKVAFASVSAGIGLAGGRRVGEKGFTGASIPLETQLFLTPFRRAKKHPYGTGFGLYGLANINSEKSFWAALFCLQIGRLK